MHWFLAQRRPERKLGTAQDDSHKLNLFISQHFSQIAKKLLGIFDARVAVRNVGAKGNRAQPCLLKRKPGIAQEYSHMLSPVPPPPTFPFPSPPFPRPTSIPPPSLNPCNVAKRNRAELMHWLLCANSTRNKTGNRKAWPKETGKKRMRMLQRKVRSMNEKRLV